MAKELTLDTMAGQILAQHHKVEQGASQTVIAAHECGQMLMQAKAKVNKEIPGSWLQWFADNIQGELAIQTARQYMAISNLDQKTLLASSGNLSLHQLAHAANNDIPEDEWDEFGARKRAEQRRKDQAKRDKARRAAEAIEAAAAKERAEAAAKAKAEKAARDKEEKRRRDSKYKHHREIDPDFCLPLQEAVERAQEWESQRIPGISTYKKIPAFYAYMILGLPPGIRPDIYEFVGKAYAGKHHPDKGGDKLLFHYITMAREVIKDELT